MALPQGINFRDTVGYVTDGANEHAEVDNTGESYPTVTAQGNNVGWEDAIHDALNRDSGNDARLAGINYVANGGGGSAGARFRIDLPSSGSHNVRCAGGDAAGDNDSHIELFDTTSSLGVLVNDTALTANNFRDATNTLRTAAAWPGSNAAATVTFTTTICRFELNPNPNNGVLAHVYIESASGGGGTPATAKLLVPADMRGGMGRLAGGFQ